MAPRELWLLLLLPGLAATAATADTRPRVDDLRYGAALFHYYRGDHFAALSELRVARARGGIEHHGDTPAVTEGGISLDFGLEERAESTFRQLVGEQPAERGGVRNAAWFYLARLHYLRGDWQAAREALARVREPLDEHLRPAVEALQVNLAIRRGALEEAAEQLQTMEGSGQLHYLYLNLAAAYRRAEEFQTADRYYSRVLELPVEPYQDARDELLAVRDRAAIAAGYNRLLQGQHRQALGVFARVRLESPFADRALLGYGRAAAEAERYQVALEPLETLSRGSLSVEATQEALLALPYVHEQLAATGRAMEGYQRAEQAYLGEITRLDNLLDTLAHRSAGEWLQLEGGQGGNWLQVDLDSDVAPPLRHALTLFARNHFQRQLTELRELMHLRDHFRQWQRKLAHYSQLEEERQAKRRRLLDQVAAHRESGQLRRLQRQRQRLQSELASIKAEEEYLALADRKTLERLALARRLSDHIIALDDFGLPVEEHRDAVRRYRSQLFWRASRAFPDRVATLERQLEQLEEPIRTIEDSLARLRQDAEKLRQRPDHRQRLEQLRERLAEQQEALAQTLAQAEARLDRDLQAALGERRQQLQTYLAQARLGVARLYDQSAQEGAP